MFELTKFKRDVLTVMAGLEKPNGLEIKAELDDYYNTAINHGRLYPNLDSLVEEGFIEKSKEDERTNIYELTEHGNTVLEDRRDWEAQYFDFEDS